MTVMFVGFHINSVHAERFKQLFGDGQRLIGRSFALTDNIGLPGKQSRECGGRTGVLGTGERMRGNELRTARMRRYDATDLTFRGTGVDHNSVIADAVEYRRK